MKYSVVEDIKSDDETGPILSPRDEQESLPVPKSKRGRPMVFFGTLAFLALAIGLVGLAVTRHSTVPQVSDEPSDVAGIVQEFLADEGELDDDAVWPDEFFLEANEEEDKANEVAIPDDMAAKDSNKEDAEQRRLTSSTDKRTMMKYVNQIRCMHEVPLFKWSAALANSAQSWANTGKTSHSTSRGAFQKYGENMCWGQSIKKCVNFWYAEIKYTSGGRQTRSNWKTSHYSQLVWKATHYIGCGINKHMSGYNSPLIVCQFKKRGNWAGRCPDCYASNVHGPKKGKSSCLGTSQSGSSSGCQCPSKYPFCYKKNQWCYKGAHDNGYTNMCGGKCTSSAPAGCQCPSKYPFCYKNDQWCYKGAHDNGYTKTCGGKCTSSA